MEPPFQPRNFDHLFGGNPRDLQTDFDVPDQRSYDFSDSAPLQMSWIWKGGTCLAEVAGKGWGYELGIAMPRNNYRNNYTLFTVH